MNDTQLTLEIWKLTVSTLTPLLVIIFGVVVARRLEKNKLEALKEKEWQVKWAELFFKHATEFNDNTSNIIYTLFDLQNEKEQVIIDNKYKYIHEKYSRNLEINWNIQNYAQFSKTFKNEVTDAQQTIMDSISRIINNGEGNLEESRKKQLKYNEAVRKAHNEILKMG
jgi:hypothetical protein